MEKESRYPDESEDFEPPMVPVSLDGGPVSGFGGLGQPAVVPERHPDNFVCLRGPCRHYWHLTTMAQEGNPQETWDVLGIPAPRKHHHICLVNPGFETSFPDDNAYSCNKWDPILPRELARLDRRRKKYFKKHPNHRPEIEK